MTNPSQQHGESSTKSNAGPARRTIIQFSVLAIFAVVMTMLAVNYRSAKHEAREAANRASPAPVIPVEVNSPVDDGKDED